MNRRRYAVTSFVIALLACVSFISRPAFASDEKKPAGKSTIAVFTLKGALGEIPAQDPMALLSGGGDSTTLQELVKRLKEAESDNNVKAVVILSDGGQVGLAQIEELRQSIARLRSASKDVYVHADSLGMGEYTLFSGATRLSVVPTGDIWVAGIYGEAPYLRGLLDKLGVVPDYLTCGAYKSAGEIFTRSGPSPEADAMQNWLFDSIYGTLLDQIAKGRNVDVAKATAWIDAGPYTANQAKSAGLIDAVEQRQDFEAMLKSKYGADVTFEKKYGEEKQPTIDLSNPFSIFKVFGEAMASAKKKSNTDAVGIVYVVGPIQVGNGDDSPFGGEGAFSNPIRKALDQAAEDDTIKAVVLRVDSPGGSATASEIILDATRRVKAKKPLVVSMGNVAGSGGYYVACASDTIFADEATITASIGVVAGKFVTNGMWDKVGIAFKPYKRGKNAGMLNSSNVFSEYERQRMQGWMDDIYQTFKGHVTAIRGDRLKKPIDELAGGRVFTGKQALELGLVDKIGTLSDAIAFAAEQAKLGDGYDVRVVPKPQNFLEKIIEEAAGGNVDPKHVALAAKGSLIDLAMPYLQGLDPQRVTLIKTALGRMQLMQTEGVIVMMPEISVRN